MNLIINQNSAFSTFNGKIISSDEARKIMYKALKENRAKLLIDTAETLGYRIS
jgi:DNA-directed RNA polymerase subunit F